MLMSLCTAISHVHKASTHIDKQAGDWFARCWQ